MKTIPFGRSLVDVTLGEALSVGSRYWSGSWDRWILAVVAVGLANGLVTWLFASAAIDQPTMQSMLVTGSADSSMLPSLLAGPLAVSVVSLVADWFLTANAIAGLRGREVTLAWVLGAGLRVLLVILALSLVLGGLLMGLLVLGVIGLLLVLGLVPLVIYVGIRLTFWELALFDGAGVEESLRRSWSLTDRATLRVLGWVLTLTGLSLLVSLLETALTVLLPGLGIATAVAGSLAGMAFQAYAVIVTAILYESQLLRAAARPRPSPGGPGSRDARSAWPVAPPPSAPAEPADPDAPPPPPPPPSDRWGG